MKTNFLNNQNYILGKTEKKKLLSKFFIEKNINVYFLGLTKIYLLMNNVKVIFPISIFFVFMLFNILLYIFSGKIEVFLIIISIILTVLSSLYFIDTFKNFGNKYKDNFITFKDYFFKKAKNELQGIFILNKIIIFFILVSYFVKYNSSIDLGSFKIIILFYIIVGSLIKFNILNLILFPFFIIYDFFILIFSILYIYIMKGFKSYIFQKNKPGKNILKKFDSIESNMAKNDYYKVKLKV